MKNILFLCTGNSCRSQMSEALGKKYLHNLVNVYSAGIQAQGLNPYAMQVLKQKNVAIDTLKSKTIDELQASMPELKFDLVVTLCDHATQTCPTFMGVRTVHHGFDDPPHLTKDMTDEREILQVYSDVCDEIESFITEMPKIYPNFF